MGIWFLTRGSAFAGSTSMLLLKDMAMTKTIRTKAPAVGLAIGRLADRLGVGALLATGVTVAVALAEQARF